jgi:hypothetical protein
MPAPLLQVVAENVQRCHAAALSCLRDVTVDDASTAPTESTAEEPEEVPTTVVADDASGPSADWSGTSIVESSAVTLGVRR